MVWLHTKTLHVGFSFVTHLYLKFANISQPLQATGHTRPNGHVAAKPLHVLNWARVCFSACEFNFSFASNKPSICYTCSVLPPINLVCSCSSKNPLYTTCPAPSSTRLKLEQLKNQIFPSGVGEKQNRAKGRLNIWLSSVRWTVKRLQIKANVAVSAECVIRQMLAIFSTQNRIDTHWYLSGLKIEQKSTWTQ